MKAIEYIDPTALATVTGGEDPGRIMLDRGALSGGPSQHGFYIAIGHEKGTLVSFPGNPFGGWTNLRK